VFSFSVISYTFKADSADNKHARAVTHHFGAGGGGAHYTMAGSRQFNKGNKATYIFI